MLAGHSYALQLLGMGLEKATCASAFCHAKDLFDRMQPRDPLEEMLIFQCLLTHARVAHLSNRACLSVNLEVVRITNEYADRAANTFRRQMLALAEYRRLAGITGPVAEPGSGRQAGGLGGRNATNEQGWSRGGADGSGPVLPAEREGSAVTANVRPAGPAVEILHWPADGGGEAAFEPECLETR
jgi:hypothetical protein